MSVSVESNVILRFVRNHVVIYRRVIIKKFTDLYKYRVSPILLVNNLFK